MNYVEVVEAFKSLQGEGKYLGHVAYFIRFKKCNMYGKCLFKCDTFDRVKYLTPMKLSFDTIIDNIKDVHHLVITGGEPTLYNMDVLALLQHIHKHCNIIRLPNALVEIETNGYKLEQLLRDYSNDIYCDDNYVHLHINYSPKQFPLYTDALDLALLMKNTDFIIKLVVGDPTLDFTIKVLEQYSQYRKYIYLMPYGDNEQELKHSYKLVRDLTIKYKVRATTRLHILFNCL